MMPRIAVEIPLLFIFRDLGLRDTHAGLIIAYGLVNLPLAILLMKSFMDDVPEEVDEAAMIDGATRFQSFVRVVLPLVRGGLAATAVLCFIFSWTEFLVSLQPTTSIRPIRSEEHQSELHSLMRLTYAALCLTKHTQQ